jgi:hypothetical protein
MSGTSRRQTEGPFALTCHARNRLLAGQIGDMNKSIIERRIDVGNAEHELALANLGP